jgi:hypothetical protein
MPGLPPRLADKGTLHDQEGLAHPPYGLVSKLFLVDFGEPPKAEVRERSIRELPRTLLLKLSEKGYEQRSDRGSGRYTEAKTDRKIPFRWPVRLRCRPLRDFSDSFFYARL